MSKKQFDFQERTPDVPRKPGAGVDDFTPPHILDLEKPLFPKEFEYPSPFGKPEECEEE
jgi:hypothetical protein